MPETSLPHLLNLLAGPLRAALDARIRLVVSIAPGCPAACAVDIEQLEAMVVEMVRRICNAMPAEGTLHVVAGVAHALPSSVLVAPPSQDGAAREWLALSVGSDQAGAPNLNWQVKPPRADLARCAQRWGAALSLLPHGREGTALVMHLPCRPPPSGG